MTDKFVTVATFDKTFEGQLAKNLLENEGIESILAGGLTADVLTFGQAGSKDQVVLQVREQDAQRATGILASVAAAKLDADWEDQAESGTGVWLCSICGEPVSNRLSVCYSCQSPREGIRAAISRESTAIQPNPPTLPTVEDVQKQDEIAGAATPAPTVPAVIPTQEEEGPVPPTASRDDLARRAFVASVIGAVGWCLLPVAWYYLLRAMLSDKPLSPRGVRHLYSALALNSLIVLMIVLIFSKS